MGRDRERPTTFVILRLDLATETISGTLGGKCGDERPFWGWLELSAALDELRGGCGHGRGSGNEEADGAGTEN
jgi:hypothetical protein